MSRSCRFSLPSLALLVLACALSACTYLIPDDPSVPRYNKVQGELHKPQLNNASMAPQSALSAPMPVPVQAVVAAPPAMPAPEMVPTAVIPVTSSNLPPPMPVAQDAVRQVPQEMVRQVPQESMRQVPQEMMQTAAAPMPSARHVPSENQSVNMADSGLANVPPRPPMTGDDSPRHRLDATRSDLEQERSNAAAVKAKLSNDAAQEPSMINEPPPQPVAPQQPAMQPRPQGRLLPINLVPPPGVAMATAPVPASAPSPAPMPTTSEPIRLTPPAAMATASASRAIPVAQMAAAPPSASGFDPFSGNAGISDDTMEMPPSRYAAKR